MLISEIYSIPVIAAMIILVYVFIKTKKRMDTYVFPKGMAIYGDLVSEGKILRSQKYALSGKPDRVINDINNIIPYEFKSGRAGLRPWEPHRIQMGVYFIILREMYPEKNIPFGVIKYANTNFRIENTKELRDLVIRRAEILRRTLSVPSRSHDNPNKCVACKYHDICKERLR